MKESPIKKLKGNILKDFQEIGSKAELLKSSIAAGKFSPGILYDAACSVVRGPYADLDTNEIYLQETYLSYLWSFIYSTLVIFEEGVHKPLTKGITSKYLDFSPPIISRARELFDWAKSLTITYSEWDNSLPSPCFYNDDKEEFYGLKAKNLFSKGVSYLLFHELSHLILDHKAYKKSKASEHSILELEKEADNFAFDILIDCYGDENEKVTNGYAIALTMCSNLFIIKNFNTILQNKHPDPDSRIFNVVTRLDLESDDYTQYIYHLCSTLLRIFLILTGKEDPTKAHLFSTARDSFNYYLDRIAELKDNETPNNSMNTDTKMLAHFCAGYAER